MKLRSLPKFKPVPLLIRILIPRGVRISQYDEFVVCEGAPNKPKSPKRGCLWVAVSSYKTARGANKKGRELSRLQQSMAHSEEIAFLCTKGVSVVNLAADQVRLITPSGSDYIQTIS